MANYKKIFRYLKRYEYKHPGVPFVIHCSIVKHQKQIKEICSNIYFR